MIPVSLSLSGFLSYRDPVEVDFNGIDLACISGPNGAGKSSLLDAITWALFGQARKRDDAVINLKSETAEVTFTFEYEGNVYRIQRVKPRDKTTVLEFQIQSRDGGWKPLTERTLRDTQVRIEETLRLDYETFVNASFFLQGKADQFTQQRPGERKRILSSILGLEMWETYRKRSFERRKAVENEISELDGRLQEIGAELGEETTRKERLRELEGQLKSLSEARATQETAVEEMRRRGAALAEQEKLVNALAEQLGRAQTTLEELEQRRDARQNEKAAYDEIVSRTKEIEAAHEDLLGLQKELEIWEKIATRFREHEKRRQEPLTAIETARARLEAEREALVKEQEELETNLSQREDLEKELSTVQVELQQAEERRGEQESLQAELNAAIERQVEARTENPILRKEMEDLKARIGQLEKVEGATCPTCGQPLTPEHRHELVDTLNKEGKVKGDRYRENQTALTEADQLVADLKAKVASFEQVEEQLRGYTRRVDQLNTSLESIKVAKEKWEAKGAKRLKEIETTLAKEDFAHEARKTLAKVDAELKEIGYDAAAHDAARKAEVEKRGTAEELRQLEKARAALAPLERELKDLEKQITAQRKEVNQQENAHEEAAARLAASQAEAPDVREAEKKMLDVQEEENRVRLEVGAARQKVEVLKDLRARRVDLEGQREGLAQNVTRYKKLERAFGNEGVPAMLIEQALPQIQSKANEILERLSAGNMSITFLTQQEYKDAKRDDLKETLDIQISDSAGKRDYEMFSGGEAFRINFAIRLALSEVLAQRAGARLQTLVIDEGFGSQDEMGRQRLVEAINLVKDDFEKILVITHIEALKDAFPRRIEVEKTQRGSVVNVV